MSDTRRKSAHDWYRAQVEQGVTLPTLEDAHLAGQECGEKGAVELICKRLRYWQKELNVAFDYAADIERGGWREGK